jgi:hypothetical protein
MEQQIKLLKAVEETLERVSICGRDNMDRMLGCMQVIASVRENLTKMGKEAATDAAKHETECGSS